MAEQMGAGKEKQEGTRRPLYITKGWWWPSDWSGLTVLDGKQNQIKMVLLPPPHLELYGPLECPRPDFNCLMDGGFSAHQ